MLLKPEVQQTLVDSPAEEDILTWIEAFLIDRKARVRVKGDLQFYHFKLKRLSEFCETKLVKTTPQLGSALTSGVYCILCFQFQQLVCERKNCLYLLPW